MILSVQGSATVTSMVGSHHTCTFIDIPLLDANSHSNQPLGTVQDNKKDMNIFAADLGF